MKKLLSVIVPVYGEAEYLDQCISSIVNQSYQHLEIILVDDGSPDECPDICDKWAAKDKRVVVIHKKNGGLVSARKVGMEASHGSYIGYVDGDDWVDADYYSNLVEKIEHCGADVVTCGYSKELFGKSIRCSNPLPPGVYSREILEKEVFPRMMYDDSIAMGCVCTYVWNKLFKRELIYSHQMNVDDEIVVGEDSICVYPTLMDCSVLVVSEQGGYHYRQRMNSLLRNVNNNGNGIKRLKTFYKCFDKVAVHEGKPEWKIGEQLKQYYICQLMMMVDSLYCVCPKLGAEFPFFDVKENEHIIVYSAGAFGIHLYNHYRNSQYVELVAWADPDYLQYSQSDYAVISPEEAIKKEFDKVVIASVDGRFIAEARERIASMGVDAAKVIDFTGYKSEIRKILVSVGMLNE